MMEREKFGKVRATILIVIGVVMGAILIQPAVAHLGGFAHLNKHFLTRAAGAVSTDDINDFTSANFTTILEKTINAPSAGVLAITASVGSEDDCSLAGGQLLQARLRVDATNVTGDPFAFEGTSDCSTDDVASVISLDAVVKATKGKHTVRLQVRDDVGASTSCSFRPGAA